MYDQCKCINYIYIYVCNPCRSDIYSAKETVFKKYNDQTIEKRFPRPSTPGYGLSVRTEAPKPKGYVYIYIYVYLILLCIAKVN